MKKAPGRSSTGLVDLDGSDTSTSWLLPLERPLTHEQIFKNLPKVLAAKAIRMKDEIHRVVQERFQPTKEERALILKTMQEAVAPEAGCHSKHG